MQQPISINTYEKLGNPTIKSTISVNDWFDLISNSEYSETITLARHGKLDYNAIKRSLPCVTYNFLYDNNKNDDNIISSTGLMYIDIDNSEFNIDLIDTSKVFAYYKSFGGKGYAIIVKVNGLTKFNFKSTYIGVINQLGLLDFADKNAIKASQFNVLSFDANIFVNSNPFIFNTIENTPKPSVIEKKEQHIQRAWGYKSNSIRFDDIDRIEIEGDYIVNWEGYENIKCFIPMKKFKAGSRNNFLLGYCNNFVYLNPNLNIQAVNQIINRVNIVACEPPVSISQVNRVVNSIFNYKKDGTLSPHYFRKKRKIVFSKNCSLTPLEKLKLCGSEWNKKQIEDSKKKLYHIIESWDFDAYGKIIQSKIYKNHTISKNTVEKYYKHFKSYIATLNNTFKVNKCNVDVVPISEPVQEIKVMDKLKMVDEVCVKEFMIGLYKAMGEPIDFNTIVDFMGLLKVSYTTRQEIVSKLILVYKSNKYFKSDYSEMKITKEMIEYLYSQDIVAA